MTNSTKSSAKFEQILDKKAEELAKKHQQRLDEMTDLAMSQYRDNQLFEKLDKQLDQHSQKLAYKHLQRLHDMTKLAVYKKSTYTLNSFFASLVKPVPIMALASIFSFAVAVSLFLDGRKGQTPTAMLQAKADIPAWVKDTDVPLDVLENLDFYVWLSKQDTFTQNHNKITLATAWTNYLSSRKRYTTSNLAQGISRKTTHTGEL